MEVAFLARRKPCRNFNSLATLHDCGKPDVFELDNKGQPHFSDHANASQKVYRNVVTGHEDLFVDNAKIEYLITHDMDLQTINVKPDSDFFSTEFAMAQILACLAEITANASMFGGIESTSFKIKFKRVERRGKMFFEFIKAAANK